MRSRAREIERVMSGRLASHLALRLEREREYNFCLDSSDSFLRYFVQKEGERDKSPKTMRFEVR